MNRKALRESKAVQRCTDATTGAKTERARQELLLLASEKLGRHLTHLEKKLITELDERFLAEGYYAKLFRGYNPGEALNWFSSVVSVRKEFAEIQRRRDAITKEQLEQARVEVMQIATEKLGRALTHGEQKVIRGFDKSLIVGGDIAGLFRGYSQQELVDSLAEAGAGPGPVALLNSLATGRFSLEAAREQVVAFLGPKGRAALEGFDFEAALKDLSQWFLDLLRTEPPRRKTRALYFGLFESHGGCQLYVSGANAYDEEDSDWACATDWCPKKRYAPLGQLSNLWRPLEKTGDEPWVAIQAIATIIVRAFFRSHHTEFKELTGLSQVYIACGFDEGDLYAIRTPLSRKA